ncbi:hypothetical protein GWK47_007020 [Chionoecetes opilio]|uniref:Uncharacterized protein n=1 Tax=Chionoecetes opilio TaxID=41210 RepID=A0A8J4Y4F0_CHIOP|nr:hypothetical protein GWK47_007020 [Chionoecetes opilio]
MKQTVMASVTNAALEDIQLGRKLTDEAIVPLLGIIATHTGIAYVEPAVLMTALFPRARLPDLSAEAKALLIVHLGKTEAEWRGALFLHGASYVASQRTTAAASVTWLYQVLSEGPRNWDLWLVFISSLVLQLPFVHTEYIYHCPLAAARHQTPKSSSGTNRTGSECPGVSGLVRVGVPWGLGAQQVRQPGVSPWLASPPRPLRLG